MRKRTEVIREWIDARKERGEITKCMFYITVPKDTDIYKDETIRKIEGMLDRNHVSHGHVDTVCGAWNLNRDWIETGEVDCIVEFCGVYPIDWNLEDVAEFERLVMSVMKHELGMIVNLGALIGLVIGALNLLL